MYYDDKPQCGCGRDRDDTDTPENCGNEVCKRIVTQKADVSIPVEISPSAHVGEILSECIGEPKVTRDKCKDTCMITVTQTISVKIPIRYKVKTEVGESEVTCHNAN
jgi:hypothetical protein